MKKVLAFFLTVTILVLSVCMLASCHEHSLVKVESVSATCTQTGTIEHYKCSCGKMFSDSEGKVEITSVTAPIDPTAHSQIVPQSGTSATCSQKAIADHFKCNGCNKLFDSQSAEHEVTISDLVYGEYGAHANITPVSAVSPKCTGEKGNIAHFKCADCNKLSLTQSFETIVSEQDVVDNTSAPVHTNVVFNQRIEPTCISSGVREHYECTGCGKYYHDQNCENEVVSGMDEIYLASDPNKHVMSFVPEVSSTCMASGTKAYYHCTECLHDYEDEQGVNEIYDLYMWTLPLGGHDLDVVTGYPATCNMQGMKDYYRCKDCSNCFLDEEGFYMTYEGAYELILDFDYTKHSSMNFFEGAEPDCMTPGQKDYYECVSCMKKYEDSEGLVEIFDIYLDPTPHDTVFMPEVRPTCANDFIGYSEHWRCEDCSQTFWDEQGLSTAYPEWIGWENDMMCHPNAIRVEEVKTTCVQDGNYAYWACTCGYFDEWFGTKYEDTSYFYAGLEKNEYSHNLIYLASKEADCLDGNIECYHCEFCDNYYDLQVDTFYPDPSLIIPKDQAVFPATGEHKAVKYNRVENTCTTAGNVEHWKCLVCMAYFGDASCENILDSVIIPAHGHGMWTSHQAKASSCTVEGNIAYSTCGYCNRDFNTYASPYEDVTGRTSTGLLPHNPRHFDEVSPTCTTTGTKERYNCTSCGRNFTDLGCTDRITDIVIPMIDHTWGEYDSDGNEHWQVAICCPGVISTKQDHNHNGHRTTLQPTCIAQGEEEIYCTVCERVMETATLDIVDHRYVWRSATASNCTTAGYSAHYTCNTCDNWFDSNYAVQSRSYFELPLDTDAHDYVHSSTDSTCQVQGETKVVCKDCNHTIVNYKPLVDCSYSMTALNDYEHVNMCKWCKTQKGLVYYHNFDEHYTCTDCNSDYDFTEHLDYYLGKEMGKDIYMAYISGMADGYATAVPSVLKIPTVLDGCLVKQVDGFKNKSVITKVILPERLQVIGAGAFENCYNLTEVIFDGNNPVLRSVSQRAFKNCTKLSEFRMPESLENVDEESFMATALTSVEFHNLKFTDVYLGSSFENCTSLEIAYFYDTCAFGELPESFFRGCTSLRVVRLPANIRSIREYAFYNCSKLEGFSLGDNLQYIYQSAFYNAFDETIDTSITIPESIVFIGSSAFGSCGLSEVYMLGSMSYDDFVKTNNVGIDGSSAFSGSKQLNRVVIGENVEVISDFMFSGCDNLTEVEFRNSKNIRVFGTRAFYNANLNMTVTVGADIEYYGSAVFAKQDGTTSVNVVFEDYSPLTIYYQSSEISSITSQTQFNEIYKIIEVLTSGYRALVSQEYYDKQLA